MSQSAVVAQVKTKLQAITGVKKVLNAAPKPAKMPSTLVSYPFFVIDVTPALVRQRTMGVGGIAQTEYTIYLTAYLGPKEMNADDAQAQLLPYSDRLRASFAPDHTLGGACFNCDLVGPADNLMIYIAEGRNPKAQWALRVQEQVAANAVAA